MGELYIEVGGRRVDLIDPATELIPGGGIELVPDQEPQYAGSEGSLRSHARRGPRPRCSKCGADLAEGRDRWHKCPIVDEPCPMCGSGIAGSCDCQGVD